MRKKLKKLCALVLSAVTVLSVLPSGLVSAETDADITAEESVQSTVYFKVPNPSGQVIVTSNANTDEEVIQTITVDDEKTTLTDNDGNTSDVALTEDGYCLELIEEVGETINLEFVASDGYEVGTYHIISDAGDENESVEEITLSDDNKYEYTFTEDDQVLEVTFKAIESTDTTSDETKEEETIVEDTTPVEETEPVAEETTSNEVTETAEETTSDNVWYDSIDEGEDPFAELQALEEQQAKENARSSMLRSGVTTNGQKTVSEALGINPTTYLNYVKTYSTSGNTYYLTTPYPSQSDANNYFRGVYDFRSPNGDRWQGFNKLQCTGFVWHVLWKCGASATSIPHLKVSNPVQQKYSYYTGGWVNWLKNNNVTVHNYSNKQAMLDSGTLDYGDIIWIWDESVGAAGSSNYHHIGIYVGDGETDKFWNSDPSHGNAIDTIHGKASVISYTVVDTAPPTGSGYIVKTSSNTSLTSGNSNYDLTGATYNIYKTRSDAQNNKNAISGKQFKIASNSGTSNTVELDAGTYYIKEVPGSDGTGYTTSSTIYTITITAGQYGKNLTPSGGIKNTPKTATIDLYKTPSNPVCVENNENYTLEGAVYGIYTNSSCTSLKTKATTNADGEFSVTGLPLGQYWVKEITASPGYNIDPNVYAVDARKEGSEAVRVFTVESHEVPIMDPAGVILKKVDSNTNGTMEDQGTMEGAEFIVKFYGVAVEDIADGTDPATLGYQPTRTWRLKTAYLYAYDTYGIDLAMGNAIKVSGDDFYYDSSGIVNLPYGVLTFQEVKSPNGYLINDEVIVQEISDKNGGNDTAIVEHVSTQKEDSLTLKLVKTQYNTDELIPGVTYRWTRPDGTVNTYTTDADGVVEFHGLTWGKHTIEEIDVPDGYAVNTNRIEFTVAQDNTITFDKEYPMSDTNGVITVSLDTEGNMDVDYTNKPAPFDLKIHKVNNHNFPLEGAEFTLYSDEKCTQVADVQVTDSNGELTFADLIPYEEYWMKETDAPPGYRIPVNDDGSDIIWKIDVESIPVNDEFTFNVNDTAYTAHSTGSFWIDGTKADRVCNMTVVNEVGMKLPNTGSSMMILLLIAGVMLMGGAIVISRKSRKTSDDDKE